METIDLAIKRKQCLKIELDYVFTRAKGATLEAPFFLIAAFCRLAKIANSFTVNGMVGRGGGDRTRPPNYKVPWNQGVAAAHQIQLLILLTAGT